jgi:hypothetical protein
MSPASTTDPTPTDTTRITATGTTADPVDSAGVSVVASEPLDRATAKAETARPARRPADLRAGARRAATLTKSGVGRLRTALGELVWFACLLAATALLLGAVLVVLEANTHNALVEAVLRAADWADVGVFSREAGVKQFTGDGALVKNAVVNWGLGTVAWLVVGRVSRRIVTP